MKKLLLLIVFAVAITNVMATSYTWNGGSSTWNTPGNWTPNGTPGTGDDVTISSATPITITLGNATLVNTLSVSGGSTISFAGAFTFTVNSGLTFSGGTKISLTATQDFMLGNGSVFTLSGMDATNYFTANPTGGTVGGLRFNTTTTTNNLYVDPAVTFYNFTCSKGTMTLSSNLKTARFGFSSGTNNPTFKLNTGVTLNITGTSTSTLNTTGSIDASASGSKVSITSNHSSILSASRQIFASPINNFEINTTGAYVPFSAITVNNLTLTAGSITNTTNNITINNGGTITRSTGTVSSALIFGTSTADRINITYDGNVSPGTESTTGALGTIGTLTVNDSKTMTLNAGNTLIADYVVVGNGVSGVLTYPDSSTPTTLTVNNNITVNAGGIFKCGTQTNAVTHLLNVGGNITNSGTFTTITTAGTKVVDVTMNGTGSQSISSTGTFNGLTISNTSNPVTAGTALSTTNLTINSGAVLNMQANALSAATTISGTGKLQTQATATAIPTGKTWPFEVEYNNATGGQSVIAGTYTGGLTMSNTSGVNTAGGNLTIGNVLTLNTGSTFLLPSGNSITSGTAFTGSTGAGTFQIGDINTTYRIPTGLTWGGTVEYVFAGNNRIVPGNYNNLNVDDGSATRTINWGNSAGETGTIFIAGTLSTTSTQYVVNQSTVEFGGVNQVLPRMTVYNFKLSNSGTTTFPATYLYVANNFDPGSTTSTNQGTIIFSGTSSQTIPAFGYYGLNINNAVGATLNSNLTVTTLTIMASAILNVAAGKQLTVSTSMTNNGTLNLLSTSGGGTATILTPASISGTNTANVEQYLASSRNWYMSSPVTGATASAGPTYYKYVEALNNGTTWTPVNSGDTYALMTGYIVKPTAEAIYNFNGTLNTGNKTISGLTSTATAKTGFNLVGNPYPSYVKWSEAVRTNVENTMWYRTHNGTNYKFYTYQVGVGAGGIGVPATVTDYIPPMQAFWVKVTTGQEGTLQFLNTSRDHKDGAGSVFRVPKATNSAMKLLRLQVSNANENDETVLYFNANASDNLDSYDSQKMFNNNASIPEIYTTAGAEKLVINGMTDVKYDTEIPLGFVSGQTNSFSIKATELKNFEAGTRIILRDKVDVVDYELNGDNAYTFTSDAVNTTSRFSVLFKSPSVTTDIAGTKNSSTYAFVNANNNIVITAPEKAHYRIYNAMGQLIENGTVNMKHEILNKKLEVGVYVVNVNNQTIKVIIK